MQCVDDPTWWTGGRGVFHAPQHIDEPVSLPHNDAKAIGRNFRQQRPELTHLVQGRVWVNVEVALCLSTKQQELPLCLIRRIEELKVRRRYISKREDYPSILELWDLFRHPTLLPERQHTRTGPCAWNGLPRSVCTCLTGGRPGTTAIQDRYLAATVPARSPGRSRLFELKSRMQICRTTSTCTAFPSALNAPVRLSGRRWSSGSP